MDLHVKPKRSYLGWVHIFSPSAHFWVFLVYISYYLGKPAAYGQLSLPVFPQEMDLSLQ